MWGFAAEELGDGDPEAGELGDEEAWAHHSGRVLLDWSQRSTSENLALVGLAICMVLFAGLMSGLTLGLLSLDKVGLEVLKRSGNEHERRYAAKILPVVHHTHYLLVTLLLCNAAAMEALPIVLDKLVHEAVAILVSVTAVLFFGEIIPQSICSKHGLLIGSFMAVPVRILMVITSPISWPVAKLLDLLLGHENPNLFKRNQLKTLVKLHAAHEGFGGKLSNDEIQIITGALDLTTKVASRAMTPMDKVFMLSTQQVLDEPTVQAVMASKPFSRVPVFKGHDRTDVVGMVLVADLLDVARVRPGSQVGSLEIRPVPRLPASTPLYDVLKLFRAGHSHMALVTQPHTGGHDVDGSQTGGTRLLPDGPTSSTNIDVHDSPGAGTRASPQRGFGVGAFAKLFGRRQSREHGTVELKSRLGRSTSRDVHQTGLDKPLNGLQRQSMNDDVDMEARGVPTSLVAVPGEPIGIVTFEDVMEELLQFEIVDETDKFLDNEQKVPVSHSELNASLPEPLQVALALAEATRSLFVRSWMQLSGVPGQGLSPRVGGGFRPAGPPSGGSQDSAFFGRAHDRPPVSPRPSPSQPLQTAYSSPKPYTANGGAMHMNGAHGSGGGAAGPMAPSYSEHLDMFTLEEDPPSEQPHLSSAGNNALSSARQQGQPQPQPWAPRGHATATGQGTHTIPPLQARAGDGGVAPAAVPYPLLHSAPMPGPSSGPVRSYDEGQ